MDKNVIRGTTPTFILKLPPDSNIDLTNAINIYFTISQGSNKITKTGEDVELADGKTLRIFLTQEESLSIKMKLLAEVQVNWTYLAPDGVSIRRAATEVKQIKLLKQLLREVII